MADSDSDTDFQMSVPVNVGFGAEVIKDLQSSGLDSTDMRIRPLDDTVRHVVNVSGNIRGYVIPYFDIQGKPIPFYRVKLLASTIKYKQPPATPNHVYFPPNFSRLLPSARYILVTEGEKKAAACCKVGIPCVALSGVDSWRNRTLSMPKSSSLVQGKDGKVIARIPAGSELEEKTDTVATGIEDIIQLALERKIPLIICFDEDLVKENTDVQTAAATFGYELRFRGVPAKHIRQLRLAKCGSYLEDKLGLDDFLQWSDLGLPALGKQIREVLEARQAFPKHPNPKHHVNKKMQKTRMPRNELQALSMAILCDLDSKGVRLHRPDDDSLYYFSDKEHELIPVTFLGNEAFAKSPFGIQMYREYNIGMADSKILDQLASQFSGEDPILDVSPEKVIACRGDAIYYQLSGGQMVKITADHIQVMVNGSDDILFQSDSVAALDIPKLKEQLNTRAKTMLPDAPMPCPWYDSLKDSRVRNSGLDNNRRILALLYSISPWFYRWRGTQLPVEMMIGEPGSGKSTLYAMRLAILTGIIKLRNAPNDMKDWAATIAHTGGLHVTDNVHMTNGDLRQKLSDELCRLVTEPNPSIEQRKLYTNSDVSQIPVQTVFAITAVKQPFLNPDIIQRSIITELDKGDVHVVYEGEWWEQQLAREGGREGWIAQQMLFMQRMMRLIREKWDPKYQASFRLINVEQLLMFAAEVYGWESTWIPKYLEGVQQTKIANTDQVIQGLRAFAKDWCQFKPVGNPKHCFGAKEIAEWMESEEEYEKNPILSNSRKIAAHIMGNRNQIAMIAGIAECDFKTSNRTMYYVVAIPTDQS
jgi:hypothetical protein